MSALKSIWDQPYTFWALLSLPAIPMIVGFASGDMRMIHQLLHPSGEFSARFMIITMMITPLTMLLRGWRGSRWLMKRRRYLGIAAFGYGLLHTILYFTCSTQALSYFLVVKFQNSIFGLGGSLFSSSSRLRSPLQTAGYAALGLSGNCCNDGFTEQQF